MGIKLQDAPMFNALFKVCESSSPERTQRERFTTEAFCGVLKSDPRLLESFLREFAGIENETDFSVVTEEPYERSFIDVTFENKNYLIFLEIKVETGEGERGEIGQLEVYANILKNQTKKTTLLFCTKYQEIKDPDIYKPISFKQFLWRDIYIFLSKNISLIYNALASEFLKYLENQNMSKAPEFTLEDLVALNRIPTILRSLQECVDQVRPSLQKHFGAFEPRSLQGSDRDKDHNLYYRNIYKHNRYSIHTTSNLLKDKNEWSGLALFIQMGDDRHPNNPRLMLELGIDNKHKDYEAAKLEFYKHKAFLADVIFSEREWGIVVQYSKSMSSFISEDNQFYSIKSWIEERIILLYQHIINNSQIEWNINK